MRRIPGKREAGAAATGGRPTGKRGSREAVQAAMPAVLDRYELKYQIHHTMIPEICRFIEPYCTMDKYSAREPDGYYPINNLYFDTDRYLFLRRRLADEGTRFNMRIRAYGRVPGPPWFFELKQKRDQLITKYRSLVGEADLAGVLAAGVAGSPRADDRNSRNRRLFLRTLEAYRAEPQVLTRYRRLAWVSGVNDYGRVTFDRELAWLPRTEPDFRFRENRMIPNDHALIFDPGCDTILELKCYTTRVPFWMIDLVRHFELSRVGFSKFVTGMRDALGTDLPCRLERGGCLL